MLVGLAGERDFVGATVAVACPEGASPMAEALPELLRQAAAKAVDREGWRGKKGQLAVMSDPAPGVELLVVHGLGPLASLDAWRLEDWLRKVVRAAESRATSRLVIALPDHPAARGGAAGRRLGRQVARGAYRFDRFRKPDEPAALQEVRLLTAPNEAEDLAAGLRVGARVAEAEAWCRDLANTPPNVATPEWMSERAAELAEKNGLAIQILGPAELESRGMGGLLAVGAGSDRPPRLVRLEWGDEGPVVALVGKGVTFDTGGISIKPSKGMEEMKYDKCGATTVLGIVKAVSDLGIPGRFRAYLPLAENMPDGRAYRPGDIVRCYNGKSVEVLNTDAEGRMILADAMSWAAEEKPDVLLEYSTLTGACVVALGESGAGLYTPDDTLAEGLLRAAGEAGERLWRMPMWSEFGESIRGDHSDLKNVGSRWGGANIAASFLSEFVGDLDRWAHLDIAGPAYVSAEGGRTPGATGFGVGATMEWLLNRSGEA